MSLGYTSDMIRCLDPQGFGGLDHLVCQCHFLNEPQHNRPSHLSLQRALPLLEQWRPGRVYFTHLSCQDFHPGDEADNAHAQEIRPGRPPGRPQRPPLSPSRWIRNPGKPRWKRCLADQGLDIPAQVAYDGLRVELG